jgi:hypothetical protein
MPRKTVYTRDDVIRAAFELVEECGLSCLTARAVANKLHSSTAPVYSNFNTMDELSRETLHKGKDLLLQYATTPHTEQIFLNMGIGVIKFARDHANMYRSLFLEGDEHKEIILEMHSSLLPVMDHDPSLKALSARQKEDLLTKMSIITHGIAAQVCVGLLTAQRDEDITETLLSVGSPVVTNAITAAEEGNL